MRKAPIVIVVGAGLSGLTCAVKLHEQGVPVLVTEAGERIGGRAGSDRHQDFILDRGFQAMLSAYPAAKKTLDLPALNLQPYYPGVQIWYKGKFNKFVLPMTKNPLEALSSLQASIGTLNDKTNMLKFRTRLMAETQDAIMKKANLTTLELLRAEGFSEDFIDHFWRPLCGVFLLERKLETSSRVFEFIMHCYFSGDAALPVGGVQSIAAQLAAKLPGDAMRMKSPVSAVQEGLVSLPQAETLGTQAIVIATDEYEAARLLNDLDEPPPGRAVTCLYYETKTPPFDKPYMILNGDGSGLVQSVSLPSLASRSYGSDGHHLIAVTLLEYNEEDEHDLEAMVREQMTEWFKEQANKWRYLKVYRIKNALPIQTPDRFQSARPAEVRPGIYRCGDYMSVASIDGAIESGRRAAEAVLEHLKTHVS
jgi:phytoene dehydrogenase-like protein